MRSFSKIWCLLSKIWCLLALAALLPGRPAGAQSAGELRNQASYTYRASDGEAVLGGMSPTSRLIDPRGQVKGCGGALLPSYQGFTIGLYAPDPSDPTGTEIVGAVPLTPTALPAVSGVPPGILPNTANENPYPLSDAGKGMYSFLLDPGRGQLDPGRVYVLLLNPPAGSVYRQRRVRITITGRGGGTVSYTATSLDGEPVSGMAGGDSESRTVAIQDAGAQGLSVAALNVNLGDCQVHPIQITKTGDRAAAEPGDTVVYRVTVLNSLTSPLTGIRITDTLPQGFDLRPSSVRAGLSGQSGASAAVSTARQGLTAVFSFDGLTLPPGQTLTLVYAALLTPEALRGDGQNSAIVTASTSVLAAGQPVAKALFDGPAVYGIQLRQGLLSDTGTLIGRVFWDKNHDGEQQGDEPGIPAAVVMLDDSTRIVTDANGLFSVPGVPAGYHTAVLDRRSLSGYRLDSRSRFIERNSPARLVHLLPGGLARINFALTPDPSTDAGGHSKTQAQEERR